MKNALLFRFILMCSVIFFCMTAISLTLYILFSVEQSTDQRGNDVIAVANTVRLRAERMLENGRDDELRSDLEMLQQSLDLRIFIVSITAREKAFDDLYEVSELKKVRQNVTYVARGAPVMRKRLPKDQLDEGQNAQMLYCVPVQRNGEVTGAVAVLANLDAIDAVRGTGHFFIMFMAIGSALVALCFIALFAYRLLRPITELETAVVKLSAGENPQDVFSAGKHEITSIVNIFNYMQHNFVEAEATRRDFLASVSHDLRSPLTSIYGYTKAMRDGVIKPEDYPKTLDIVTRETRQLIRLTGEVLEAAKIEYGRLKLFKENVALGQMMREIVEATNAYPGIEKRVVCEQEIVVYADASRLRQVFTNIVTNACKYNRPDGSVTITVAKKGVMGVITVADTGYGVSEDDQAHIFEKFYRVDKSRSRGKEGSGLGLYVAKKLIDLHQGKMAFSSVPGKGSTMTVELPV